MLLFGFLFLMLLSGVAGAGVLVAAIRRNPAGFAARCCRLHEAVILDDEMLLGFVEDRPGARHHSVIACDRPDDTAVLDVLESWRRASVPLRVATRGSKLAVTAPSGSVRLRPVA